MLHHTSKFDITIIFHTSLAEGIIKRRLLISDDKEYGQDMCTVTDTSSDTTGLLRMLGKFDLSNCSIRQNDSKIHCPN